MDSQVERVNAAWERIEKWFSEKAIGKKLNAGATSADIASLETYLGFSLPEELKTSLKRHNGSESWTTGELNSVKKMRYEWGVWTRLAADGTFDGWKVEENDYIQKCWFNKSWLTIDANGCGDGACIDLNPGPKGTVGQIIFMDHEVGPSGPLFPDFAAYLENVAKELESGKYGVKMGYLFQNQYGEDDDNED